MGVLVTKWTQSTYRWWFHKRLPPMVPPSHNRAEHPRPTLPWFAGARSDLLMVRLLNKKINPVWLIFALLV